MKKIINPIKTENGNVFISIELQTKDNQLVLSICGVEGPKSNGDCKGSSGQIHDTLIQKNRVIKEDWDGEKIDRLYKIWREYHLNDMQPGTPAQMKAIEDHFKEYPDYDTVCEYLKTIDLYVDKTHNNYKYGHGWLYKEIPDDVIDFLKSLPNTKIKPAWV